MLISIGQFSKTCSVSIKTLRYYDKVDLLKPARVDKYTGYRYYDVNQLKDMLIINRLKRYGFTLIEIKAFLLTVGKNERILKLQQQAAKIEAAISSEEEILKEIKHTIINFERTGEIMNLNSNYSIALTEREDIPILSSRQNMSVEDFGKYYGILFTKIAREGLTTTGEVLAIYHDKEFDENNSDIEVGIKLKDKEKATRILSGGLCAWTTHKGSYANLPEAYASLVKWIEEKGYKIAAPPYEIYRKSHVDNIPPEDWETDIYFPITNV